MRAILVALLVSLSVMQPAFAEDIVQEYRGLRVSANLVTVGARWQDKPVLLMTHGTLAHNRMEIIATLQQLFAERGYSSLAVNLGLGVSDRKGMYDCMVPHRHKHTDALDEIGLWRDWLKAQGVKSIVLLGHSRGGNQTAWFAAERDDPAIRAVLLIAPAVWDAEHAAIDYRKRYGKALAPVLAKAQALVAEGRGEQTLQPVDFIYCKEAVATAAAFASYYTPEPRFHTPRVLNSIDKPVLVFAGSDDTVVAGLEGKMQVVSARENITLTVVDGADHFFRDLYAEDVADQAVEFIEAN